VGIRCLALVLVMLAIAPPAHSGRFLPHRPHLTLAGKVRYFERSVRHERQVVAWLKSRDAPRTLERRSELRWFKQALAWHRRLLIRYSARLRPDPRAYAGPCLAAIIDSEGSGWNPTRYNSAGSGAYGLPQALPGSKMASAGPDWATNPYTQIRWAHSYAVQRYGSDCGAWAHWQAARSW
jgi:hypothetical protein